MPTVLVVDDHRNTADAIHLLTGEKDLAGIVAHDAESAYDIFKSNTVDLVITDVKLPGRTGLELLQQIREIDSDVPVIVITAFGTIDNAVEAMKLGAFDYISKPVSLEELDVKIDRALSLRQLTVERQRLQWENEYLREEAHSPFAEIVGQSPPMQSVFELVEKVAPAKTPVLILGESGTGKELIARAIHTHSTREGKPFIKVNCAALSENILESELFGHEKGAFTGAIRRKPGRFEIAADGTIFLDEIGEISPNLQVKLLRVLQEREFERVGGIETIKMEARLLAATNQNLENLVRAKTFREDLYYRLNVVSLQLPPLRERGEDIPMLVRHFISKYRDESGKQIEGINGEAMKHLMMYPWPGNIRELENAIERAIVLTDSSQIALDDFTPNIIQAGAGAESGTGTSVDSGSNGLSERIESYEKHLIQNALIAASGNMSQAAVELGIKRTTLRYKMEKYNLLGQSF